MNILQIIAQGELRSGGAIQMYRLSKNLSKLGHKVTAAYKKDFNCNNDFENIDKKGIDLIFLELERIKLNFKTIKIIRNLRKFIKENNFDIIHAHKGTAVDLVYLATFGLKIPIVTNRGVINPLNFFSAIKYRSKKIKKIIAVSQAVKNVMIKTGNIKPDKIEVVYGSVDIDEFKKDIPSTIRQELEIPSDMFLIGFVGNAGKRKGINYLLEGFFKAQEKYKNIGLLLVGVSYEEFLKFPESKNIKNNIFCAGFRTDVPNCMAGMDMFVFSGISEEGLTGTVREAASMSLPIITTNVAGNSELIFNNQNGLVVEMKNSNSISEAIVFLIENPTQAKTFGKEARKFVETNMSNEVRSKKLEKIYIDIINLN